MSSRSLLNYVAHKVIGARASPYLFTDQFQSNNNNNNNGDNNVRHPMEPESNFGTIYSVQEIAKKHRLIFCGEIHSEPSIVSFQYALLNAMCSSDATSAARSTDNNFSTNSYENIKVWQQEDATKKERRPVVHVIMEHFSFEMQQLLDDYLRNKIISTFDEFSRLYHEIGIEGHDLDAYETLLNYARDHTDNIYIHAGFLSRKYARMLMKEGPQVVLENASQFLPTSDNGNNTQIFVGTSLHFSVFESLLSGRPINVTKNEIKIDRDFNSSANEMLRKIFPAQVMKDVAMAHKVNQIIDSNKEDKFLVIAGNGHVLHYCGVPERVLQIHPELSDETCVIVSASAKKSSNEASDVTPTTMLDLIIQDIIDGFGPKGTNPADYVFLYEAKEEFPF